MNTGTRKTRQREAIRDAIAEAKVPVSPREILDRASSNVDGIGLATVYRTLKLLVDAGEILAVDIPGDTPRYELAGKGHHHHFVCKGCQKVFELEGCCGHFSELTPKGFSLEGHDLTLFGRCDACAKPGKKDKKLDLCASGHCNHPHHTHHPHHSHSSHADTHAHVGHSDKIHTESRAKRPAARAKKK